MRERATTASARDETRVSERLFLPSFFPSFLSFPSFTLTDKLVADAYAILKHRRRDDQTIYERQQRGLVILGCRFLQLVDHDSQSIALALPFLRSEKKKQTHESRVRSARLLQSSPCCSEKKLSLSISRVLREQKRVSRLRDD